MIRAFPRLHDRFPARGFSLDVHFPKPLGIRTAVDQVLLNVRPLCARRLQIFFFLRIHLITFQKTNDRLRLHPPDAGGIDNAALALVMQGMSVKCGLVNLRR